jgi:hypothetical protein
MGRGRAKALLACLGALALTAAGCGAETHENAERPAVSTRISVAVTDNSITVQPNRVGIGAENPPTQQIPQNHDASQPQRKGDGPLTVAIVAANLTDSKTKLVLRGPSEASLDPLVANGNGTLVTDLDEGIYTVTATGLTKAAPAKLTVGSYRTSSQNDVLLP